MDTWIGYGHTISWVDSEKDCFPGTEFNSTIILPSRELPESFTQIKNGENTIKIYSAIPLYSEELKFKLDNDADTLIDKFNEFNIQEIIDLKRINTCKK